MVDSTENTGALSLAVRERLDRLAQRDELRVSEVLELEWEGNPTGKQRLLRFMAAAYSRGKLALTRQEWTVYETHLVQKPIHLLSDLYGKGASQDRYLIQFSSKPITEYFIERETYRAWRAQCPLDLLSPLTQIHKWLGDPPAIPLPEPSLPEPQAAIAATSLSLAERAKRGLLVLEDELLLDEILELACGDNADERKRLLDAIRKEIKYGDIADPRLEVTDDGYLPGCEYIKRESFRAFWVESSFALQKNKMHKWLGATPAIPLPEPIPPVAQAAIVAATPEPIPDSQAAIVGKLRPDQQDKLDCLKIARQLWNEQPGLIQAELLKNPDIRRFIPCYKTKTVKRWLSEIDPRPKESRRGRPRKPV